LPVRPAVRVGHWHYRDSFGGPCGLEDRAGRRRASGAASDPGPGRRPGPNRGTNLQSWHTQAGSLTMTRGRPAGGSELALTSGHPGDRPVGRTRRLRRARGHWANDRPAGPGCDSTGESQARRVTAMGKADLSRTK
jgi:hypothetical protein